MMMPPSCFVIWKRRTGSSNEQRRVVHVRGAEVIILLYQFSVCTVWQLEMMLKQGPNRVLPNSINSLYGVKSYFILFLSYGLACSA